MTITYYPGDVAVWTASFTDDDGVLTDPTTVTFTIGAPGATALQTVTPARQSTGVYTYQQLLTVPGVWFCIATGTGAVEAVIPDSFTVLPLPTLPPVP